MADRITFLGWKHSDLDDITTGDEREGQSG
jgi:hypothetical protein